MKKTREIFWRYFVEKKWGRMAALKEPTADDKVGAKLFGVMNLVGFVIVITLIGIFLTFFLIMTRIISGNIIWSGLIAVLFMEVGAWGFLSLIYYFRLRFYFYVVIYFISIIILLFFAYYFFIGGLK